jgi:predicted nucleic acid-binding protein
VQGRDESTTFVLDASVLINLLGSGAVERLLMALPGPVLIADRTFREVLRDPSGRIPPADIRQALAETGLVEVRSLDDTQALLYLELASAPDPDRLDDGEAATVALAVSCGAVPVLDETKACRVYRSCFPNHPLESTAGLFRRLNEGEQLPPDDLRSALYQALRQARMHVVPEETEWVVRTMGPELARQCPSLSWRG